MSTGEPGGGEWGENLHSPFFCAEPAMEKFRQISETISLLSSRLIYWTLVGMVAVKTVIVIIQVLLRYIFFYSLSWSEEVARFLMIWVSFLTAGLAVQKGLHIGMESLIIRLSPRVRR
jgi:TRAP-type C4-dicarboxylate transport system permease small subunit